MVKQEWKNRIINTGVKPASDYLANPANWRGHPKAQREALKGVLAEVGWVTGVIENRTTGHLIDGHARIEEALKIGDDTPVPFIEVELTQEEETLILASLDPLGAMAFADKDKLDALLKEVSTGDAAIQAMLADMANSSGLLDVKEPKDHESPNPESVGGESNPYSLKTMVRFKSSNALGIPDLLPDMLSECPEPIGNWLGGDMDSHSPYYLHVYQNRSSVGLDKTRAILSFYTRDVKFEDLWFRTGERVEMLLQDKWLAVCSPNYSLMPEEPVIVNQWNVYRSRWLARYFQSVGIRVIPDVDWVDADSFAYCLMGIPSDLPCISIQVQTTIKDDKEIRQREEGIARIIEELRPHQLLVYGANPDWIQRIDKIVSDRAHVIHVRQLSVVLHEKLKAKGRNNYERKYRPLHAM